MRRVRPREQGFSLLEVIVAMAIGLAAIAIIYRMIGDSFRASSRVQALQATVGVARSHLDALGSDGLLTPGITTGTYENGIRWRLSVADLSSRPGEPKTQRPYWITLVTIDRAGVPVLRLETAKIAREAQQ